MESGWTSFCVNGDWIQESEILDALGDFRHPRIIPAGVTLVFDEFIHPFIGDWSGGTDVDTGATNRKLGSDMADSVTGGGLHGKDLSKAAHSANASKPPTD